MLFLVIPLWILLFLGAALTSRWFPVHRFWGLSDRELMALRVIFAVLFIFSIFLYFNQSSNVTLAVFLVLFCGVIFAGIFYLRVREQRYLKKPTREAVSQELRDEIRQEREESIRKSEKFQELLRRFGGGSS